VEDCCSSGQAGRRVLKTWQAFIVKLTPLWLFLLAPFLLFPNPIRASALLGLPFLWYLNKREKGYFIRRTPLDWSILILLLMVLVSIYATFSLEFSLAKLAGLLFHIVIFYAVIQTVETRQGLNRSLGLYLFFGLMVIGFGLLNTQWLFKISLLSNIAMRLPVLVENLPGAQGGISPNQLAGTLLLIFPLALSLLLVVWRHPTSDDLILQRPIFLWFTLGLALFTFILTQSRGGWIGGVMALAFLGALWDKRIRWLSIAGLIFAIGAATYIGWDVAGELLVSDATEAVVGNLGSLGFRQEVWGAAMWGAADFPFTGMGLGTFREVSRVLYPMNVAPGYDIAHAHNHFLQTALDLGIAGLIAYIALWLGSAYLLFQALQRSADLFVRGTAMGVGASLAGYFVYGLSDTIALGAKPGFFLWWLFALSVGLYQQSLLAEND